MNRAQQYFDQLFNLPETRRYAVQLAAEMLSRHTFGPKKERVPVQGLPAEAYYSCELAVKESRGVTAPNNAGSAESFEVMVHLRGRVSVPDQTQPGSQVFAQCGSVDSSLGILYLTTRRRAAVHLAQYNTTREIADALCPILTWDAGPDSAITFDCIVHETADRFNRQHYTLVKRVGSHQSQVGPDVYKRQDWVCVDCHTRPCATHLMWRSTDQTWANIYLNCCENGVCESCKAAGGCRHTEATHLQLSNQHQTPSGYYRQTRY